MTKLMKVALRNLSRNKRRSIITLTALVLGVTLVLTAKGFANGFIDMSVHDVVEGSTGALQVHRAGYLDNLEGEPLKLSMPHTPELIAKIKAVAGVKAVTGRIQFDGLINNGLSQTMFAGRGLDLATEYQTTPSSIISVIFGIIVLTGIRQAGAHGQARNLSPGAQGHQRRDRVRRCQAVGAGQRPPASARPVLRHQRRFAAQRRFFEVHPVRQGLHPPSAGAHAQRASQSALLGACHTAHEGQPRHPQPALQLRGFGR